MIRTLCLTAALALGLLPTGIAAQELTEDRVKEIIAQTLRENPELVLEALQILEQRQAEEQAAATRAAISADRDTLDRDPNAPVLGNPDGDVTIVEFFDYNCPYFKRAMPELVALFAEDPNVRLVLREWPILSEGSVFAARAARAALASRVHGEKCRDARRADGHAWQGRGRDGVAGGARPWA